jgi:hypothetical protein
MINAIIKALCNKIRTNQCDVIEAFIVADSTMRFIYTHSLLVMEVLSFDQDFQAVRKKRVKTA